MFHRLRHRLAGRFPGLVGIVACWLSLTPALVAQDDLPLLPEEISEDLTSCDSGYWSVSVYESTEIEGEDRLIYFAESEPEVLAEDQRSACSGQCKGIADEFYKDYYGHSCESDRDCPIDKTHKVCRDAMKHAAENATKSCKGGADCTCFAKPQVIEGSYKGNCETGVLGKYCSYKCSACAEGNCLRYPKSDCGKKK